MAAPWTEETVKQCLYLYLALLPQNHKLIHELAAVYTEAIADIKRTVLRVIEQPVRPLSHQALPTHGPFPAISTSGCAEHKGLSSRAEQLCCWRVVHTAICLLVRRHQGSGPAIASLEVDTPGLPFCLSLSHCVNLRSCSESGEDNSVPQPVAGILGTRAREQLSLWSPRSWLSPALLMRVSSCHCISPSCSSSWSHRVTHMRSNSVAK